jgi:hypothetical protein
MSKYTFKYSVHDELKRLNDTIDRKILRGESYGKEARIHRKLRNQLSRMKRMSWLSRSFGFASFL